MKVIILAAGYATRLRPLTDNLPKPLLAIGGKTILDRIVEKVVAARGWDTIYIITNATFFGHFSKWRDESPHKEKVRVVSDGSTTNDNRLGAIRDIEFVLDTASLSDDILIVAGDNLFEFELESFLAFATARSDGASIALYDIGDLKEARSFGVLKVDADQRVVDFEEKPERPKSTTVSTGIYYFPKNKLPFIKEYVTMQNKLDAPGNYIGWLAKRDKVYGFAFREEWYDIGNIAAYEEADRIYTNKGKGKK